MRIKPYIFSDMGLPAAALGNEQLHDIARFAARTGRGKGGMVRYEGREETGT